MPKSVQVQSISHKSLALIAAAVLICAGLTATSQAEEWKRGDTLFGELKYGPQDTHYQHVNPQAPKGGTLQKAVRGNFDSFNPFIARGRPAAGLNYFGGILYDNLFSQSVDQASAALPMIADAFQHADDFSWAIYRVDNRARWHDGTPITPEDVIWSLGAAKQMPQWQQYFTNVTKAEKVGDHEVKFTFDQSGNRELPHIMGDLAILPKHWWQATGANGEKRDITNPITEPPLGSGPYRIAAFEFGKFVEWERVADYWAKDLLVRKGRFNFDRIRYSYFFDDNAVWETFKKGGGDDYRIEGTSRRWANGYEFPAAKDGRVVRKSFPETSGSPFQGLFFNTRISKFAERKVRKALSLVFDFEFLNKNRFFGLYTRTDSYFEGGELQASAMPQGRELEILENYRGRIPAELFDKPFSLPVFADESAYRPVFREAINLFKQAGYRFEGGKMLDPSGAVFTIEIIYASQTMERVLSPYVEMVRRLGVDAQLRLIDTAQFINRLADFDFEITMATTRQSLSPGNEQRDYWSSAAANLKGSRNFAGISDPVIDELVERIVFAEDRAELVALTHALDRILMWNYYAIPTWHSTDIWLAYWNKIVVREPQPSYIGVDPFSFWIDETSGAGQQAE